MAGDPGLLPEGDRGGAGARGDHQARRGDRPRDRRRRLHRRDHGPHRFVKRVATTYTISDRRLNIKRGIVARNVQETRLQRVQNVNFEQGVYERMMQIGDVEFTTAGTEESNFVFAGVAQPEEVVEQVDRATHAKLGDAGLEGTASP